MHKKKEDWKPVKRKFSKFIKIVIVLIVIFLGVYLYSILQSLLQGNVVISITPQQQILLIEDGRTADVTFNTAISNNFFCRTFCQYQFIDLSKEIVIDNSTLQPKRKLELPKNYTIPALVKGTGQSAYEFRVQCQSQGSIFCSSEKENIKSSFLSVVHEYSLEKRAQIEQIKLQLQEVLIELQNIELRSQTLQQQTKAYYNHLLLDQIETEAARIEMVLLAQIKEIEQLKQQWQEEDYEQLQARLPTFAIELNEIDAKLRLVETGLSNKIFLFNQLSTTLNEVINYDYDQTAQDLAMLEQNYSLYQQQTKQQLSGLVKRFNIVNYTDENLFLAEVNYLENQAQLKTNQTEQELQLVVREGQERFRNETNKSVILTFNDTRADLSRLCLLIKAMSNASLELKTYYQNHCEYLIITPLNTTDLTLNTLPELSFNLTSRVNVTIFEHQPICCLFGECGVCQQTTTKNPVILVHGHAVSKVAAVDYSLHGFEKIRQRLVQEGYFDAGTILPTQRFSADQQNVLGKFGKPTVMGTTYYLNAYDSNGTLISVPSKSESIETYAERLNTSIELVKFLTGAEQVDIIAFSMGGLVSRQYLVDFGEDSVGKLILIGTPNKGTEGTIEGICPVTGSSIECAEMSSNGPFIHQLNSVFNAPKKVDIYTIVGKGCQMQGEDGDGAVLVKNSRLGFALNFEVSGSCSTSVKLHQELRDLDKYPEVGETIVNVLKK